MFHAAQRYGARCVAALLAAAMTLCAAPVGAQETAAAPAKPRQLSLQNEPWTGDFDQMLERRVIRVLAPNIHAGAKYMNRLMTRYFEDAHFSDQDRTLFAFASYNTGPGNISRMRGEAAKRGLDPDTWFDNVEVVMALRIGLETTTYVRNIFKYYVAYKLALDAQEAKARATVAPR